MSDQDSLHDTPQNESQDAESADLVSKSDKRAGIVPGMGKKSKKISKNEKR